MTNPEKNPSPQATPQRQGPSWGFMLGLIVLAMLVATGIAWLFIHPFLVRR
ncbi:MAG TPA: hypothetical protein VL990_16335 [Acidobacteriaceae bacterium]|nr:hypothetical protein [Acidobacteriaceae bacterium]